MDNRCHVEKTIKIPLSELRIIRFVCLRKGCSGVAEMHLDRLLGFTGSLVCPCCGKEHMVKQVGAVGGLMAFAMSHGNLTNNQEFSVEFVVPMPDA